MDLGMFSVSLNVKSMKDSLEFYQALGFEIIGGNAEEGWIMIQNNNAVIGLFQGMLEDGIKNVLTFNPPDLKSVQKELREKGYQFELEDQPVDEDETALHAMFTDPDGNLILLDQY